jgi:hypothetical protein
MTSSSTPIYGGRNTPEQIAADAANPAAAAKRDSDAMVAAAEAAQRKAAEEAARRIREANK